MNLLSIAEVANRIGASQREVADCLRLNAVSGIKIHRIDGYRRVDESDLKAIRKAVNRLTNGRPRKPKPIPVNCLNAGPSTPATSPLLNHLARVRQSTAKA
jgi:hypothetical protein